MDIINLPYPMFKTTEQEKELLRRAEMHIADPDNPFFWLCTTLNGISRSSECEQLRDKISASIGYTASLLFYLNIESESAIEARYIRRIWITKLLNYKGQIIYEHCTQS